MIGAAWAVFVLTLVSVGVIRSLGPPGREVADGLRFISHDTDEPNYGGIFVKSDPGYSSKVFGRFMWINSYEEFVVGEIESGPYDGAEPGYFVIDLSTMYCRKELSEAEYQRIFLKEDLGNQKPVRRIRF